MTMNDVVSINPLDKVRIEKGNDELRNLFSNLLKNNKEEAIGLINDDNLRFTSLFILKTDIEKYNFISCLSTKNQSTFQIIDEILKKTNSLYEYTTIYTNNEKLHTVLKWILKTGFNDDGLSDEYDEILDITSAVLITEYKDMTILPIVANIIFDRNKKGTLIHDLVWSIFQSEVLQSLTIIGERLLSPHPKDVKLARELLGFISELDMNNDMNNEKQYLSFMNWLSENGPFLSFTGESFQQCSNPSHCSVRLDSKYLCRTNYVNNDSRSNLISEKELKLLEIFNGLGHNIQVLLSTFSFMLYRKNPDFWSVWISCPITGQIDIAKKGIGGFV